MSHINKKTSQEARPNPSLFQLTFVDELLESGDVPDDLVEGLLPSGGSIGFVGEAASGKSLMACHLAACVATGQNFFERPCQQGLVVYLWGEGQSGARPRLQAIEEHHHLTLHLAPLAISKVATSLLDEGEVRRIKDAILRAEASCGMKLALLIIDTLARHLEPGDESKAQDMSRFLGAVDYLRENATAVICHHTGHGNPKRARGSSSWKASLDAEYTLQRKGDVVTATCQKMKDGEAPRPLVTRIQVAETRLCRRNGKPLTSAVLVVCKSNSGVAEPTGKNQIILLRELRRLVSGTKSFAWTEEELRSIGRAIGMPKNSARSAVHGLQEHAHLVVGDGGLRLATSFDEGTKGRNGTGSATQVEDSRPNLGNEAPVS